MPPRAACALAILLLTGALAICGCGGAGREVEPPEGSSAAAVQAAAGPLSGLVGQLESEDDEREHKEREQEPAESADERLQGAEEAQSEESQHHEREEQALEEEAHVGANGSPS